MESVRLSPYNSLMFSDISNKNPVSLADNCFVLARRPRFVVIQLMAEIQLMAKLSELITYVDPSVQAKDWKNDEQTYRLVHKKFRPQNYF